MALNAARNCELSSIAAEASDKPALLAESRHTAVHYDDSARNIARSRQSQE